MSGRLRPGAHIASTACAVALNPLRRGQVGGQRGDEFRVVDDDPGQHGGVRAGGLAAVLGQPPHGGEIGLRNGTMLPANAAALVGAGVLTVLVFPAVAVVLRRPRIVSDAPVP